MVHIPRWPPKWQQKWFIYKMATKMATKLVHFPIWPSNWQLKWYIFQDGHQMATAMSHFPSIRYRKACVKWPLYKRLKIGFQDQLSLIADQNYCRMHLAITFSSFIRLPIVIKIFVLPIFECPFYTGFTVLTFSVYQILTF